MGGLEFLLLPLLLIGFLWLMSAPQRRMRKEQLAMQQQLAPGAEVMTHGGLYGTVVEIVDDVVVLETAPGVTMRWATRAIARIVTPLEGDETEAADDELDADEEYADEEYGEDYEDGEEDEDDEEYGGAEDGGAEDAGDADVADEEWDDVEVPDDASSLTTPDDDEQTDR